MRDLRQGNKALYPYRNGIIRGNIVYKGTS